jgi:hypothetical protein
MRFASLVRASSALSLLSIAALSPIGCMNSGAGGGAGGGSGTGSGGNGSGGSGSGGSGSGGGATGGNGSGGSATGAGGSATGAGGSVASGGATGSGGAGAKGGSTGSGGAATGGTTGAGGSGSGGTSASGGTTGTGGAATGGSGAGGAGTGGAATGGTGGAQSAGCSLDPLTTIGTLPGRYGTMLFDNDYYFMQVNEWNSSASQVMSYGGDYLFKMTTQTASTATNGGPTGFPSIFIGANSKHMTTGSNLPKAVTALTTVPVSWTWDDAGTLTDDTTNSYNATYDVWFSTSSTGEPSSAGPSGGYLMVWYHKPADAQPIGGSPMKKGITIAGVPGTWDVWIGPNGTRPCISYVATQTTTSLAFDLNLFIQDAVKNQPNTILSTWYLTNIFTGFEIWRGAVNVGTTSFCAKVN